VLQNDLDMTLYPSSVLMHDKLCIKISQQYKIKIHWGLGILSNTVTETTLHDSLNVLILSVRYGYRDPLLYGYRDPYRYRDPLCSDTETSV